MIIRAFRLLFRSFVFLVLLAVGVIVYLRFPRPLRYSILFNEEVALRPGAPVRLGEYEIGRVSRVEILPDGRRRVTVSIDRRFQDRVRANSTAVLSDGGDSGDEKTVDVHNLDPASPPISPGAEVEGADSWVDLQFRIARRKAEEWFVELSRELGEIVDRLAELRDSGQVEALRQRASVLAESMGEWARQHSSELEAQYPAIREELGKIYARAKAMGDESLSEIVQRIMELFASPPATPTPSAA